MLLPQTSESFWGHHDFDHAVDVLTDRIAHTIMNDHSLQTQNAFGDEIVNASFGMIVLGPTGEHILVSAYDVLPIE